MSTQLVLNNYNTNYEALRLADSTALAFKSWQNFIKANYFNHDTTEIQTKNHQGNPERHLPRRKEITPLIKRRIWAAHDREHG